MVPTSATSGGDYLYDEPSGSMALHLASGYLLPSLSAADSHSGFFAGFDFKLTDAATSQVWELRYNLVTPPTGTVSPSSTLAVPVGPGDYLLSWSSLESYQVGHSGPGYATLNLAVVPEPASLAAFGVAAVLPRRRRRR